MGQATINPKTRRLSTSSLCTLEEESDDDDYTNLNQSRKYSTANILPILSPTKERRINQWLKAIGEDNIQNSLFCVWATNLFAVEKIFTPGIRGYFTDIHLILFVAVIAVR